MEEEQAVIRQKSLSYRLKIMSAKAKLKENVWSAARSQRGYVSRKNRRRTGCEKRMMKILGDLELPFEEEFPVFFVDGWKVYDFKLDNYPIVIEVDGNYWHADGTNDTQLRYFHLKNMKNDWMKNWIAKRRGFRIVRFWENEVLNQEELVVERLLEEINRAACETDNRQTAN